LLNGIQRQAIIRLPTILMICSIVLEPEVVQVSFIKIE
jgi:hypothetical protein